MNRLIVLTAVVAVTVGVLAGFLWWGLPTGRLQAQLSDAQTGTDHLRQQLDELRARSQRLEAQLGAETTRREHAERDLQREKEIVSRLHMLVSEGKK